MKIYVFALLFIVSIGTIIAQDTLLYRNNTFQLVKILESSNTEIKYRIPEKQPSKIFIAPKSDFKKIIYQDGSFENLLNPKYQFKLFNPSIYLYYGSIFFANGFTSSPVFVGIGHDGLFKLINIQYNQLTVGLFYSFNFHYDNISKDEAISRSVFETYYYKYFDLSNPYGIQLDFGSDLVRLYFQGMVGPNYAFCKGLKDNGRVGVSKGFGFGLKVLNAKFGLGIAENWNNILDSYCEVRARVGIEL